MREFMPCPKCLTVRMQASKLVENRRTLQMVCPKCGTLDYIPVWGARVLRPIKAIDADNDATLRQNHNRGTLQSVPRNRKGKA